MEGATCGIATPRRVPKTARRRSGRCAIPPRSLRPPIATRRRVCVPGAPQISVFSFGRLGEMLMLMFLAFLAGVFKMSVVSCTLALPHVEGTTVRQQSKLFTCLSGQNSYDYPLQSPALLPGGPSTLLPAFVGEEQITA